MNKHFLLTLVCWLAGGGLALAQEPSPQPVATPPPLPPGPLMQARAPEFASWVIRPERPAGKAPDPAAPPESITVVTKTGKLMLRQTTDGQTKPWSTWCVGAQQITVSPDSSRWVVQSLNPNPDVITPNFVDYSTTDFPGFEWISLKNYVGITMVGGKKCIAFKGMAVHAKSTIASPCVAYTDLETRLPVALEHGYGMQTYVFQPPPQAMLTLPPLVQSLIDNQNKTNDMMTRKTFSNP